MKPYMREATSRNQFVLVLNRGGKYIEVKRRFRTLDDACDYGVNQMQSFLKNDTPKADGYCVINWDEYKIELYDGDFPTSGVFAKDLYANSPTFSTYTIYPKGSRNYSRIEDTQNESKGRGSNMKLSIDESALKESYVSDLIAKMSIFGYNFVRSPYDTEILEFEDANGSVRQFYDWDEVEDFVSQLKSQKTRSRKMFRGTESKSSSNDMKLRINESRTGRGKYPVRRLSVRDGELLGIDEYPNFSATGSVSGMRRMYYGDEALLVKCGGYIYNVSDNPNIYWDYAE